MPLLPTTVAVSASVPLTGIDDCVNVIVIVKGSPPEPPQPARNAQNERSPETNIEVL